MYYFATFFDKNYLARGLVTINSIIATRSSEKYYFYILALDNEVEEYFKDSENIGIISMNDLESTFPELLVAKENRSYVEYLFTLSPFLPLYIFKQGNDIHRITTLDADMLFLFSPTYIIDKLGDKGIGITLHDFPKQIQYLEKFGKYNVSFQSFPNTDNSLACLKKWSKDCISYCGDNINSDGNYADQKYLDKWHDDFSDIFDFDCGEVGLAPWNVSKYKLKWNGKELLANGRKVVFFHFHGFRILSENIIRHGLENYNKNFSTTEVKELYKMYWNLLMSYNQSKDSEVSRFEITKGKNLIIILLDNLFAHGLLIKISNYYYFINMKFLSSFKDKIYGIFNRS